MVGSQDDGNKPRIDPNKLGFQILNKKHVVDIDCTDNDGKDSQHLQDFIDSRALKCQNSHIGTTYIVMYCKKPIGYITLATSSISKEKIVKKKQPRIEEGPIYPALAILYFAVDKKLRKCGFGSYVLRWCIGLARVTAKKIGCRYIVLFARDAIDFYQKRQFQVAERQGDRPFKMMYADLFPEKKSKIK